MGPSGDPLCQILDQLERSIEQAVPMSDANIDPTCRVLDQLEDSIDHCGPGRDAVIEELDDLLGDLEYEIEQQDPVRPRAAPTRPGAAPLPKDESLHQGSGKEQERRPIPEPPRRPEALRKELTPLRQYPESVHRMTGQNTGIRGLGSELAWYCNMHRNWVAADECDSCSDFERADHTTEDEDEERCRHSFFDEFDDETESVEEILDSDSEADE